MIKKRVNTDIFFNLIFKEILSGKALNYVGSQNMTLEIKRQGLINNKWINQQFTLTEDGVIHFQWNADENISIGIYDARLSYYKTSSASENGKIQYKYDAIGLFMIIPTSDGENTETDTTNSITVSVSWGGFDGMSAYEIAVKHGYEGTEEEFANIEINNAANEVIRQNNERARDLSESDRQSKEIEREQAESTRQSEFETLKQEFQNMKTDYENMKQNLVFYN